MKSTELTPILGKGEWLVLGGIVVTVVILVITLIVTF